MGAARPGRGPISQPMARAVDHVHRATLAGQYVVDACADAGISVDSFNRWRPRSSLDEVSAVLELLAAIAGRAR